MRVDPITKYRKYIISGKQYRDDPISVIQGNHDIYRVSGSLLPTTKDITDELCYAHYMFRGLSRLKKKAAIGWIANNLNRNWNGEAIHYKNIIDKIINNTVNMETVTWANITCCDLTNEKTDEIILKYVHPEKLFIPVPALKYTENCLANKDEFVQLLEFSLMLAQKECETK